MRLFILVLAVALLQAAAQPPSARVQDLLRRMTLEEKLSLVHGTRDPRELGQAGYWPGSPRLGIPPLRFADGPPGISANREASGLPAPIGLAATFDAEAARLYGVVMGRNAVALEQNVVLAPYVNIIRDPTFRRNPHCIQRRSALKCAHRRRPDSWHPEPGRDGPGEARGRLQRRAKCRRSMSGLCTKCTCRRLKPRCRLALRPRCAPTTRSTAIGPAKMMHSRTASCAGSLASRVSSPRIGARFTVPVAITKGLDLEMPGREIGGRRGGPYFTSALKTAVESGRIPSAAVDLAVSRILEQMVHFGLLDRKPAGPRAIDVEADAKVIRGIAAAGAVLLHNQGNALPLTAADLASLVLIGPTAESTRGRIPRRAGLWLRVAPDRAPRGFAQQVPRTAGSHTLRAWT